MRRIPALHDSRLIGLYALFRASPRCVWQALPRLRAGRRPSIRSTVNLPLLHLPLQDSYRRGQHGPLRGRSPRCAPPAGARRNDGRRTCQSIKPSPSMPARPARTSATLARPGRVPASPLNPAHRTRGRRNANRIRKRPKPRNPHRGPARRLEIAAKSHGNRRGVFRGIG